MSITTIIDTCKQVLFDLQLVIEQLPTEQYQKLIPNLFNASVGQHSRHIIEFFQCLQQQALADSINYDLRQRNLLIENSNADASTAITEIINWLDSSIEDKPLNLFANYTHSQNQSKQIAINIHLTRIAILLAVIREATLSKTSSCL